MITEQDMEFKRLVMHLRSKYPYSAWRRAIPSLDCEDVQKDLGVGVARFPINNDWNEWLFNTAPDRDRFVSTYGGHAVLNRMS